MSQNLTDFREIRNIRLDITTRGWAQGTRIQSRFCCVSNAHCTKGHRASVSEQEREEAAIDYRAVHDIQWSHSSRQRKDLKSVDRTTALRSYYARLVAGKAGTDDAKLIEAFSLVERERFIGPGPWKINCFTSGYVDTPADDLTFIYQDVIVALDPERQINNGEPQLHARCLSALRIRGGETAIHVGSGTGYYTAILAHLVGPAGTVHAYEIEPDLARKAETNLAPWPRISVRHNPPPTAPFRIATSSM